MPAPTIVQSVFSRGNSASLTLTIAAPTIGNLLLLIVTGFYSSVTTSSDWISLENSSDATSQQTCTFYKHAGASEPTSITIAGLTDWHNIGFFELTAPYNPVTAHGACSGSGSTTIVTGSLLAITNTTNSIRFLVVEWDNNTPVATTPGGYTLLSPSTWMNPGSGAHGSAIFAIPATATGTQSITMSANTNNPVWLDISVTNVVYESVAKVVQYTVLKPPPAINIAKIVQYTVLDPPAAVNVAKMVQYVVLNIVTNQSGMLFT